MINLEIFKVEIFERSIDNWSIEIDDMAKSLDLPNELIKLHIKLHLPSLSNEKVKYELIPTEFKDVIFNRLKNYKNNYGEFVSRTGILEINSDYNLKKNILTNGVKNFKLFFKEVDAETSKIIEQELHYLMSHRDDTFVKYGLFLENNEMPICYASFEKLTRNYKINSIYTYLKDITEKLEITNLSRLFGVDNLPKCIISKFISQCALSLKTQGYNVITTSVNPMLGFKGISYIASGFKPFAKSPVTYNYLKYNGQYISRRNTKNNIVEESKIKTTPNLLLIKGTTKEIIKQLNSCEGLIDIDFDLYSQDTLNLNINISPEKDILTLRNDLEKVWDKITRYHRTNFNNSSDPISKGQCGVTTAYLAQELEEDGFEVLFCEGNLILPTIEESIYDHCWIKIPSYSNGYSILKDLIIDLTADQNGYEDPVICSQENILKAKGINYNSSKESKPSIIKNESLTYRLDILKDKLNKLN